MKFDGLLNEIIHKIIETFTIDIRFHLNFVYENIIGARASTIDVAPESWKWARLSHRIDLIH